MKTNPKVFISYAHDTEQFSDKVLEFVNKLREEGINVSIDQYEESPPGGWPRWMEKALIGKLVLFINTFKGCNVLFS